jgi:hypothetical protein
MKKIYQQYLPNKVVSLPDPMTGSQQRVTGQITVHGADCIRLPKLQGTGDLRARAGEDLAGPPDQNVFQVNVQGQCLRS